MSFKVPDRLLTDGQCRMMINGIQFIQVLLEANGLAAGKDHQFKGRYDAEKNAVIISLEKDEQEMCIRDSMCTVSRKHGICSAAIGQVERFTMF